MALGIEAHDLVVIEVRHVDVTVRSDEDPSQTVEATAGGSFPRDSRTNRSRSLKTCPTSPSLGSWVLSSSSASSLP